ncbi:hypothetical protein NQ317_018471 [Molorchus minor]|uniref:Ribosomal protein L2 n=1 Tax=Molorchus minor TaxID=1323400 RepID=A0ABQ9IS89_9CUCU|nr:hypothetical protein NQ317_018471 [Molorchus minor]
MNCLTNCMEKLVLRHGGVFNAFNTLGGLRYKVKFVDKPEIGKGKSFRRIVHFPDNYTVEPLNVTNLAGRDPKSGRLVVKGIGGGIKHKYHWIDWKRVGPSEGPPQIEKVIKIIKDGLRPNEGDAYPLGALPIGTQINCVEKYPGMGGFLIHSAGTYATIVRKAPNDHVVIMMPSKREFSLPAQNMCTVGRLSNVEHSSTPIGSAQRNRELGNRPRSGLWQRKKGIHGRKIRRPPPVKTIKAKELDDEQTIVLTCNRPFVKTLFHQFHY